MTRPDRPRGRGRKLPPPPVADAARALGIERRPAGDRQRRSRADADRRRRPDVVCVCAFGALIKEPLLSEHRDAQRPSVAAAALARRGAGRARDHGRRRARPACRSCASPRASTAGRCACARPSRSVPTTRTARSRRAWRALGARAARARARRAAAGAGRAGRGRRRPTPRRSTPTTARSTPAARADELERIVRALHPHIGARVALPERRASAGARGRALDRRAAAGASWPRPRAACCGAAPGERSSSSWSSRPAGARWTAADYLRGHASVSATPAGRVAHGGAGAHVRGRAPTPTAPSPPRPGARASRGASAPSPCAWPTAPCSGETRSTT